MKAAAGEPQLKTASVRSPIAGLPRPLLRLVMTARNGALRALEPIDFAARVINGQGHLPPLALRRYVGPLSAIESSAGEFVAYLKLLCNLNAGSRVLDIGCGFGLMAIHLAEFLKPGGGYVGIDINTRAINWANKKIASRNHHCRFVRLDIKNLAYNRKGTHSAQNVRFPFADESFDVVILKSVFTHLRPDEVRNYISEVSRLLTQQGRCLASFFLLDEPAAPGRSQDKAIDFRYGEGQWRYAVKELPELAIAYDRAIVSAMAMRVGLSIEAAFPGSWSGSPRGLSYQDLVLMAHDR
jgi:SAM-dependent methyltransferase